MKRAGLAALAPVAAALIVAAFAACGDDAQADREVTGVGQSRAGSVASLAQCRDWSAGTEEEKLATITDIRAQLNQVGADGPTPDLADQEAYDLFERACANDYAAGLRLYKVYARAAAFSSRLGE